MVVPSTVCVCVCKCVTGKYFYFIDVQPDERCFDREDNECWKRR